MVRTRVGYTGGTSKDPTYTLLGDHSEAIQIDYDPEEISYEEIVGIFWDSHDPYSRSWSRQYKTALFYHDKEQKKIAETTRDKLASATGEEIATEILPFTRFYPAEDYHQKHFLRNYPELFDELSAMYPSIKGLISSTAAARVNGYLGGNSTCDQLKKEINELGLSEDGTKKLIETVCGSIIIPACSPSATQKCVK